MKTISTPRISLLQSVSILCLLFMSSFVAAQSESEPNDVFSEANSIGPNSTTGGKISYAGDVDYYQVMVPESGVLTFEVKNVSSAYALQMRIFDESQTQLLGQSNTSKGQNLKIDISVCSGQLLYVYLRTGNNDHSEDDTYQLSSSYLKYSDGDAGECNNTFSTATQLSLNQEVTGYIGPWENYDFPNAAVDKDYYKVIVTEPGFISYRLSQVPADLSIRTTIYDDEQKELRSKTNAGMGSIYGLDVTFCEAGTYYFYLRSANNSYNLEDGYAFNLDFTPFSAVDKSECNNSFGMAHRIQSGEEISAMIAPWENYDFPNAAVDLDYYKISVITPSILRLSYLGVPSDLSIVSRIYDDQQQQIVSKTNAGNGSIYTIEQTVCEAGDYYLFVRASNTNYNLEEPYQFTWEVLPLSIKDPTECNNTYASAAELTLCDTVRALITPSYYGVAGDADFDYYQVQLEAETEYSFNIDNKSDNLQLRVTLRDASGAEVAARSGNTGQDIIGTWQTISAGTYYVIVNDRFSDYDIDLGYELTVGCSTLTSVSAEARLEARVYPNPTSNLLYIQADDFRLAEVIGLTGEVIIESVEPTLNVSGIVSGLYVIRITDSYGNAQVKIFNKI